MANNNNILTSIKFGIKTVSIKYGPYILFFVFTFFTIFTLFRLVFGLPASRGDVKEVTKNVKVLETKVDSISENQNFLISRIYQMEENQLHFSDAINRNNMLIQRNNQQLDKLKKVYNEKITTVNHYSYNQLDSFFAKRYHK
jgi:hypothetical protein